ncbi:MAG: helix-turn-helix domain-containing protein [Gemmataceae bacterium]|nr:helix-turn-helix domain-containing protein [Gemmataceae bacterium]
MTQGQLAQAAKVPLSSLQNWEIDRREPGFRAVVRLAQSLGVSVEVLADTTPKDGVQKLPRAAGPTAKPRVEEMKKLRKQKRMREG